jgi:predicted aspartyl protease
VADGLLDSGADRTVLPQRTAERIGVGLSDSIEGQIKTAGGVLIGFRLGAVVFELRAAGAAVRWRTTVAFAEDPLNIIHLGHRGFLEFFHCQLLGPEQRLVLIPQANLPVV